MLRHRMDLADRVLAAYNPLKDTSYVNEFFGSPTRSYRDLGRLVGNMLVGVPIALARGGTIGAAAGAATGSDVQFCATYGAMLDMYLYVGRSLLHYAFARQQE
jgi:hypothetical protein